MSITQIWFGLALLRINCLPFLCEDKQFLSELQQCQAWYGEAFRGLYVPCISTFVCLNFDLLRNILSLQGKGVVHLNVELEGIPS